MQDAVWAIIGLASGCWSALCGRSDVVRQRAIGNTFGEAHITDSRWTLLVVSLISAAVVVSYSAQQSSIWLMLSWVICVVTGFRVSLIDIDTHSIPRRVMMRSSAVLCLLLAIAATTHEVSLLSVGLGALMSWAFMRFIELMSRGDVGHADIVLSGFQGLLLGAVDLQMIPTAFFGAFVSAGLVAVVLMATRRMTRHSHLPLGPFLVLGMVVAVLR